MNQKAQTFAVLAENTASQLTKSYTEWTGFLGSMGRLYKYPYIEQVFIYAQRPEATACASYDMWNKRMGRVVRRGCKGIALPDAGENSRGLRYVFDIEDTVSRNGSRRPYVWEYLDEHEEPVTRILAEKYGITDEGGLAYQLEAIAQDLAGGYWEDHMEDILASVPGSFLEEFDELNIEMAFREAASVSTAYVLFSRCGLDPDGHFSKEDFMPVFDFNTLDAVTALGTAVSENSEQVLRQIEIVAKNHERTRRIERRRELYGEQPGLPAGGGLPAARIRGGNTIDFGEIRTDAGEVSAGGAPGTVQPSDSKWETDNAPVGDRADRQPEIGADDAGAEEVHGPDGAAENPGPHEVGGPDEQRESESGGTDFAGTHLHLTAPAAPTGGISDSPAEDQIVIQVDEPARDDDYIPNLFELADSAIFQADQPAGQPIVIRPQQSQEVIDAALTLGANDPDSRLRIIAEFMKNKPLEENARFLQAHYKENGAGFYIGERKYSLWYNESGMQIAPGESALTFNATALTWEQAAERIRELLDEGKYASQAMLYRAWPFEKNRVAQALQYLHRDIDEDYKDKYLPTLTAALDGTFIYPDVVDKTKELLEQPEHLEAVIGEFMAFQKDYAHNRDILRFHSHRPDEIVQGLVDLQCTPLIFAASPDYAPVERFFISQDEIDALLREQSQANDHRIALYNFFEQHPDCKEREKYLSHLHGEYSGYHGGNDNITYTHKELTFSHGSITNPYAAVKLKWPQVRKRIEELIKGGKFLSAEDREIMESRTLEMPSEESPAPPVEPEPLSEQSEDEPVRDSTFQYRRLSQMKADCEYFLGAGNRKNKHLWEESVFSHIKEMRRIYDLLPEKPEWLTMEEIDSYAKRMTPRYQVVVYHSTENGFDEKMAYQTLTEAQRTARQYVSGEKDEDDFQYEGAAVWDLQERQWLFVKGYFPVLDGREELPYLPYKPDEEPKRSQSEQAPTVQDLYEKYKAEIITALSGDQPYRNACQNSDKDTAYLEGAAAIKRVVLAAGDDTLTKLYFDNVKFHNDLHRETLDETYPLFSGPEQATTVQDEPTQETNTPEDLTDLQKKAREIAKRYEDLPVQEKIGIIAQTFGCTSGQIETSPCTGKWQGTSDISIRFDNGVSLFIGNEATPKARTAKARNECVNKMLVWYNPEIARITKETALAALKQREKKDNAIAAEKGLKPYTLLNVELHNGTHGKDSGYIGWYYVTLAVDGKIHAHLESGLNHEISFGKAGESPTNEKYFVAGALKETEVDYVFNNVGHSSASGLYTLPISDDVRERAEKTLAKLEMQMETPKLQKPDGKGLEVLNNPDFQSHMKKEMEESTPPRDPLSPAYKAGDTVYLDNTAFTITEVGTSDVHLQDPAMAYPVFRAESKENFEKLLRRDERNSSIIDYLSVTIIGPADNGDDLRDVLTSESGLLNEQGKEDVSAWLRGGAGNAEIARRMDEKFGKTVETMALETGEQVDFSIFSDRMTLDIHGDSRTVMMYDLRTVAGVLRAMYQQELGGFRHEPVPEHNTPQSTRYIVVSNEYGEKGRPFTIWDSWNRLHYAEVGDTVNSFGTREEAQTYADTLNSGMYVSKPVAIYPAEKNNLPFDVVIEKLHIEEPQRGPKAQNFHITDDNLGAGGAKAKYQMNMAALHALQKIESENRTATRSEQETLSKYVGWGALADAFDESKPNWASEYKELLETLTPEEYESARASTLNSHYTSPTVIKAIYQALENMGFKGGNVLEPSCGVGNFFGLLPESMAKSKLYGVELDGVTGRIAKQLYPNAHIEIKGYEQTNFEKNSFDLAIGNVPFGNYQVFDPAYNKLGFSIHNYFFAKAIDQVRPGGIIAFVTSRYTMDSKSSQAREYMAQRAELLGAIRLPKNAFQSNAGTEVVSDILFLQKREQPIAELPDWVQTEENKDGYTINSYFIRHPEMILGEQSSDSTQYGRQDFTVNPLPGADLGELLKEAISRIEGHYAEAETAQVEDEKEQESIPADPEVKNFSYTITKGDIYYRQDSVMVKVELGATAKARTTALIDLRDCTRRLIAQQTELSTRDEEIKSTQAELNRLYDNFTAKFGLINDKTNERAFSQDSSYYLLCALEILDDEGKFVRKSDMFTKRTIYPHQQITHVDTAAEALAVSIGERARVDIPFMAGLTGKAEDEILRDLQGQIYRVPMRDPSLYQTADEYLSGNVREKLKVAQAAATVDPAFNVNVSALEAVQPRDLDASEISVRLGTDWIDQEYIEQFMYEILRTPGYAKDAVHVMYSPKIHAWNISNKTHVRKDDVAAHSTYGTTRVSAYKLLEDALNLQNTKVYDLLEDAEGNEKRVLNAKETTLVQQKQAMLKLEFQDWIWRDPDRREKLVRKYNDEMNCIRPREYDGSHLVLAGMNPEIQLEEHQKNAIARAVYGGNTLFAHCVGAGKTFEMTASAMEMKRLGLCSKSMIVVPNHLTQQWASEFLRLYPNANILVTTKRDFEKDRRKKFCSRIATGNYDAVIIGYSQFEKIPISKERRLALLHQQIDSIVDGITLAKAESGQHFTVKNLERTKRSLEDRLKKLQADHRKDNVINFEELGIDRLFVDESDCFKNLFIATKMQNVAGLSTSDAQKSSDMFNKTRYLDEITDYKGVIFATGTPISNSITEMFTVQRYLQYNALQAMNMEHFDCWASRFGETVTAMELAPEGTGYRPRERFAKFFNLPELIAIFHEVADVKTEDMLNLPLPDVEFHNVVAKPTAFQKEYVQELSQRAGAVRVGEVKPTEDNLLKITNDGRKLGLDQRLIDSLAEDDPDSKINICVENILKYWEDGKADRLTQVVFSDLSIPKKDGRFNVYEDIKQKLVERGVPENEVAFIHDAKNEVKRKELFAKVRSGKVRVLIGSTQKLGTGTNIQDRLIALHHLDVPWRPRDLTQRDGRIKRRGNKNDPVHVFRYVTEGTFDAYLYQTVEKKQRFIGQIMTSKSPARTCDDVDEVELSYAEIKALCAGDPRIKERMELDVEVAKLQVMQASHRSQQYNLEDKLRKYFPQERQRLEWRIEGVQKDLATLAEHPLPSEGYIGIELHGQRFTERKAAGVVLLKECKSVQVFTTAPVGEYRGLKVFVKKHNILSNVQILLKGAVEYTFDASDSDIGNIIRLDNALERLPEELEKAQASLENVKQQMESAKAEVGRPFSQEQELKDKLARIAELDVELKMADSPQQRQNGQNLAITPGKENETPEIPISL